MLYGVLLGIVAICILIGFGFLWAFPLMWAWNYVMPSVFGLGMISYWQMWCLYFILTSLWKVTSYNAKR